MREGRVRAIRYSAEGEEEEEKNVFENKARCLRRYAWSLSCLSESAPQK